MKQGRPAELVACCLLLASLGAGPANNIRSTFSLPGLWPTTGPVKLVRESVRPLVVIADKVAQPGSLCPVAERKMPADGAII